MPLKHATIPAGADQVGFTGVTPSLYAEDHAFYGGTHASLLIRSSLSSDGSAWVASTAGVLQSAGANEIPAYSTTLQTAVQDNITRTGALVSGSTGAGFTVALSVATVTGTLPAARLPQFTGGDVVTAAAGSVVLALQNGTIFDATVNAAAAISWSKISKAGSSLADLATRAVANLSDGANVPLLNAANSFTASQTIASTTDDTSLAVNPAHATYTGSAIRANTTRAANSAFNLLALLANGVNQFVVNGVGTVTAAGAITERARSAAMGEWTAVAYNAANFTASSGNWTVDAGDQLVYKYTLVGKTMTLAWSIANTDVSAGSILRLAIPGGFTAASNASGVHEARDSGAAAVLATCRAASGQAYIELYPSAGTAGTWTITAADNTTSLGTFTFEIS